MFAGSGMEELNLSSFNTVNVTSMGSMFYCCYDFNCDLSNWDVSNVKNMNNMFYCCKSLKNIVIPNSIQSIGPYAFSYCERLTDITLSKNITSMLSTPPRPN